MGMLEEMKPTDLLRKAFNDKIRQDALTASMFVGPSAPRPELSAAEKLKEKIETLRRRCAFAIKALQGEYDCYEPGEDPDWD